MENRVTFLEVYKSKPTLLRNCTGGVRRVGLEDSGRFMTERRYPASEIIPRPIGEHFHSLNNNSKKERKRS